MFARVAQGHTQHPALSAAPPHPPAGQVLLNVGHGLATTLDRVGLQVISTQSQSTKGPAASSAWNARPAASALLRPPK